MVSLYVCDFPQNLEKEELSAIFENFDGYIETRTARDRSGQKIAFVDYTDREKAQFALQSCLGFRFQGSSKGITLRLSENSKLNPKPPQGQDKPKQAHQAPRQMPPKSILKQSTPAPANTLDIPMTSLTQISSLIAQLKDNPDPALQSQLHTIQSLLGQINPEMAHSLQPQYSLPSHQPYNPVGYANYDPYPQYTPPPQFYTQPMSDQKGISHALQSIVESLNPSKLAVDTSSKKLSLLAESLKPKVPPNATSTVYVEGLPANATEREVSHLFRPYPGFKQLRLIPRDSKDNQKVYLCFADFETVDQSTVVIQTMQGYRFDKDDLIGLQFSYATKSGHYK